MTAKMLHFSRRRSGAVWAAIAPCLVLSILSFAVASASAATSIDERPDTDLVSPADVDKVMPTPGAGDRVLLDGDAPRPDEGNPIVVPISDAAPEGVLGVVTGV